MRKKVDKGGGDLMALSSSIGSELIACKDRVVHLIGKRHWPSVGFYREELLRRLLAERIPRKYEISHGFVLGVGKGGAPVCSSQQDVIVWDSHESPPVLRDGSFAVVHSDSCRAVIEVKSNATPSQVRKGLEGLDSLSSFHVFQTSVARPAMFSCLFCYGLGRGTRFPGTFLDHLSEMYSRLDAAELTDRLNWSQSWEGKEPWSFPWVDMVSVLGVGTIALQLVQVGSKHVPTYVAFRPPSKAKTQSLEYGAMESLLLSFLSGSGDPLIYDLCHPGESSTRLPTGSPDDRIEKIMPVLGGRVSETEFAACVRPELVSMIAAKI